MNAQYNQPGYPQQQQGGPPPKKGMSGCMIALIVMGGLCMLMAIGAGVVFYKISQNPDVQKAYAVGKEGLRMAQEAQSGPGTSEVRALGCQTAMSFDMKRFVDLMNMFDAGNTPTAPTTKTPARLVQCTVASRGAGPSCEAIAKTFFAAAPNQTGEVAVMVQSTGSKHADCSKLYSATGTLIGNYEGTAPDVPQDPQGH